MKLNKKMNKKSTQSVCGVLNLFYLCLKTPQVQYTWRIDLSRTEKYWRGWFEGLSNKFLSCEVPKLLLLAGKFLLSCHAQQFYSYYV